MKREKQVGIQVARAVAALSIVYFHSWVSIIRFPSGAAHPIPGLSKYGWFAVELFFAISGYVICIVASRQPFDVRSFLIKRIFRLYPFWLVMLTTFAITAWLWRGFQPRETFDFFLYSAALLPTQDFPFYNIGWTLQHEIAFYLIAAAIVPFFGLRGLAVFLFVSTMMTHFIELPTPLSKFAIYHAYFLTGVVAFLAQTKTARFGSVLPLILGTSGVAFCLEWSYWYWTPIPLFFLIVGFANLKSNPCSWWQSVAVRLGDASYSMYLIHPMVFFTASSVVSKFPNAPLWTEEPIRFVCIGVAISLALLTWRYFEKPIIRFGNRIAAKKTLVRLHDDPIRAI